MSKQSSLERKMLSYFGLMAAASLLITLEFIWAISVATPEPQSRQQTAISAPSDPLEGVRRNMAVLRDKAVLMFGVQAVVTLIVLVMFMRRITGPLQRMYREAGRISDGDLTRTIEVRSRDEIGLIGETINGLTSNIQEIVALGLATEDAVRGSLLELRQNMDADPRSAALLEEMETKLAGFKAFAEGFTLLPPPRATG
ncbi:MAG: HAMP domain-containing protein [Deltaproteobacteria bacterium]|nr:HAMP domain-containing protein [Deltaproteobacteria bacterium]